MLGTKIYTFRKKNELCDVLNSDCKFKSRLWTM